MSQITPLKRVSYSRTSAPALVGVFAIVFVMAATLYGGSIFGPKKALAATNSTLNFQARLENSAGNIAPDGYYNVEFKLYNVSSAGSALWTETYYDSNGATAGNDNRIEVRNGYVTANLGSITAFPGTINWDQDLWVTMNIGGTAQTATPTWDGEMNPRLKLTGVPYAFKAGQLATFNASTGFTSTLSILQPTVGNQTFQIADQGAAGTYTLCIQNSANCGFAAASGSANYIQNGSAVQVANFSIQSGAAGTTGGVIRAATSQTADLFQLQNSAGTVLAKFDASGGLTVKGVSLFQNSVDSSSAFQIQNAAGVALMTANTASHSLTANQANVSITSLAAPASPAVSAGSNQGGSLSGAAGTTYYYKVTSLNAAGESLGSSEISIAGSAFTPLAAPGAPTVAINATAGNLNGTYTYKVTFVSANGETTGGTTSAAVSPASQQVNLSAIPVGPAGTTQRKIYRTAAAGADGTQKLVTTIADNTTTTYTDNLADASLGAALPGSNTARTNTNNASISFATVTGATSYRVYRGTAANGQDGYQTTTASPFTDTGAAGTAGSVPSSATVGTLDVGGDINTGSNIKTGGTTRLDNTGNLLNIANFSSSGTIQASGTTGSSFIMSKLGLGTTSPQTGSALTIANASWLSAVDAGGTGYVNMFQVNAQNQIQVGAALNIDGSIILPTNGGQMTLIDLGIDGTAVSGAKQSYSFRVGSTNALTVYGEADGAGNAQNVRVAIGSSITPAYTLDVGGDVNTTGSYRINGTSICTSSGCTPASGSGNYIQNQNAAQQATSNFWLSGTGRADTALQTPLLDTASAGALNIGTTNATAINLNQSVTVASGKSLTLTDGVFMASNAGSEIIEISNAVGVQVKTSGTAAWTNLGTTNDSTIPILNLHNTSNAVVASFGANDATINLNISQTGARTFSTGTGAVSLNGDVSIANGKTLTANGTALFKNNTNSTAAFQVQNAAASIMLTMDTTNGKLTVNQGGLSVNGLPNPSNITLSSAATGGTLAAATYYYRVSATGPAGETMAVQGTPSNVTTTGTTSVNTFSWSAVTYATGYRVYRTTDAGATWFVNTVGSGSTSLVDNGSTYTWATSGSPNIYTNTTGDVNLTSGASIWFAPNQSIRGSSSDLLVGAGATGGVMVQSNSFTIQDTTGYNTNLYMSNTGATTFKNRVDSTASFQIQSTAGINLFSTDSTNGRIQIGSATADGTGVLLVLDIKNTAADPPGVPGAMYYNSAIGKFRCYDLRGWNDCQSGLNVHDMMYARPTGATMIGIGGNLTNTGTMTNNNQSDYPFTQGVTGTTAGNDAGYISPTNNIRRSYNPTCTFIVRSHTATNTGFRVWVGLFSAAPTNAVAGGGNNITFRYSSVEGDTGWVAKTRDGTNATTSGNVSGVTVANNTTYILRIRVDNSTQTAFFSVNGGAETEITTTLPALTTDMGYTAQIMTSDTTADTWNFGRAYCEFN